MLWITCTNQAAAAYTRPHSAGLHQRRSGLLSHLPSGRWFRGLRGSFCQRSKIMDLYCMSRRPGFS